MGAFARLAIEAGLVAGELEGQLQPTSSMAPLMAVMAIALFRIRFRLIILALGWGYVGAYYAEVDVNMAVPRIAITKKGAAHEG